MLTATQALLDYLQLPARDLTLLQAYAQAVLLRGGPADARALLTQYLRQPADFDHGYLLPVLARLGDEATAEALYQACCPDGRLLPEAPPEVLEVLGQLGYAPAKPALVYYAFGPTGYYEARHAALGLLHFDCRELEPTIRAAIEDTLGKNLFPEFIPALVSKLPERAGLLARLFESGTEYCSTDCNAGLLLGFALCGAEGRPYFQRALFSPAWEADSGSTGTVWYAHESLQHLGLRFEELYAELRQLAEPKDQAYALRVLLALLAVRLRPSILAPATESFADLYAALYDEAADTARPTLPKLAAAHDLEDEAQRLETLLELRLHQEILLSSYPA